MLTGSVWALLPVCLSLIALRLCAPPADSRPAAFGD
jgi:hypothetical protein